MISLPGVYGRAQHEVRIGDESEIDLPVDPDAFPAATPTCACEPKRLQMTTTSVAQTASAPSSATPWYTQKVAGGISFPKW